MNDLYFIYHGELIIRYNDEYYKSYSSNVTVGGILGEITFLLPVDAYIINCSECSATITSQVLSLRRDDFGFIESISSSLYYEMKSSLLSNYAVKQPVFIDEKFRKEVVEKYQLDISEKWYIFFLNIYFMNSPPRPNHESLFDISLETNEEYIVDYEKIEIPEYVNGNVNEDEDVRQSKLFEIVEANRKLLKTSLNKLEKNDKNMDKSNKPIDKEDIVVEIKKDDELKEE